MEQEKADRTKFFAKKTNEEPYSHYHGAQILDSTANESTRREPEQESFDFEQVENKQKQKRIDELLQSAEQMAPKYPFAKISAMAFVFIALAILAFFAFISMQSNEFETAIMWKSVPVIITCAIFTIINNFVAERLNILGERYQDLIRELKKTIYTLHIEHVEISDLEQDFEEISTTFKKAGRMVIGFRIFIFILGLMLFMFIVYL